MPVAMHLLHETTLKVTWNERAPSAAGWVVESIAGVYSAEI